MAGLIVGFVLGFMVATSGFSGVVHMLDQGVTAVKSSIDSVDKK